MNPTHNVEVVRMPPYVSLWNRWENFNWILYVENYFLKI